MLEVWMLHSYQKVLKNLCYETSTLNLNTTVVITSQQPAAAAAATGKGKKDEKKDDDLVSPPRFEP